MLLESGETLLGSRNAVINKRGNAVINKRDNTIDILARQQGHMSKSGCEHAQVIQQSHHS